MLGVARFPESLGEYDLVRRIGRGAMGHVFEVRHRRTGASYAAKLVDKANDLTARERFRREAELLARCDSHPGIVRVHTYGETDESVPYMIMDLVRGEGLDALLEREERLEPLAATRIARDVARALGHAHARGVVHRDVKPSNVLLDESGAVKLTDFGIATACDLERLTQSGVFVGTVLYCAPEQASGIVPGPQADVFAVGCILYEALTECAPLADETSPARVLIELTSSRPLPDVRALAPSCPPALAAIIARALAKDPADRPKDGSALAEELTRFIEEAEASSASSERPPTAPTPALAPAGVPLVVLAALALVVVLGVVAFARSPRPSAPPPVEENSPAPVGPIVPAPAPVPGAAGTKGRAPVAHVEKVRAAARSLRFGIEGGAPTATLAASARPDLALLAREDPDAFAEAVAPLTSTAWLLVGEQGIPVLNEAHGEKWRQAATRVLLDALDGVETSCCFELQAAIRRLRTLGVKSPAVERDLRADGRALFAEHPLWAATLLVPAAFLRFERDEATADLDRVIPSLEAALAAQWSEWPAYLLHDALEVRTIFELDAGLRGERLVHIDAAIARAEKTLARSKDLLQQKRAGDERGLAALHLIALREGHVTGRGGDAFARHREAVVAFSYDRPRAEKDLIAAELARLEGRLDEAVRLAERVRAPLAKEEPLRATADAIVALAGIEKGTDRAAAKKLLAAAAPLLSDGLGFPLASPLGLTPDEATRHGAALDR